MSTFNEKEIRGVILDICHSSTHEDFRDGYHSVLSLKLPRLFEDGKQTKQKLEILNEIIRTSEFSGEIKGESLKTIARIEIQDKVLLAQRIAMIESFLTSTDAHVREGALNALDLLDSTASLPKIIEIAEKDTVFFVRSYAVALAKSMTRQ